MTDKIETKIAKNQHGFDWDIQVKNAEGQWITQGHFRDCEFGRFTFDSKNEALTKAYFDRALNDQEYDCSSGHYMLEVFSTAFAEMSQ